jgi:hypothetical protein
MDKLEPLPDYGDHMTMEEFLDAVDEGCFIDYDGSGEYATATHTSNKSFRPSTVRNNNEHEKWSHVVWFNR